MPGLFQVWMLLCRCYGVQQKGCIDAWVCSSKGVQMHGQGQGSDPLLGSPPSEPYVRFSRIRLSRKQVAHLRDWHNSLWALANEKNPYLSKIILGQRMLVNCRLAISQTLSIRLYHFPPLTPLSRAASILSVHTDGSTQSHIRDRCSRSCLALLGTNDRCSSTGTPSKICFPVPLRSPEVMLSPGSSLL